MGVGVARFFGAAFTVFFVPDLTMDAVSASPRTPA
jgi:hypothetical protein